MDEFRRLGWSVVGVDAGLVGGAAAGRNGGILRAGCALFHHAARSAIGAPGARWLYRATVEERERIVRHFPDLARRTGWLRLAADRDDEADCRAHLAALTEDGFPAEWYDGPLGTGLVVRDDAVIDPLARCRAEARDLMGAGVPLFENSRALRMASGVVECEQGVVRCRATVVAVDGALDLALPELAGRVWPMRLQMLASEAAGAAWPHAISSRWGWEYGQQLPDGRLAFGGCRDAGGDHERTRDATPSTEVQGAIERRFEEVLGFAPRVTHRWAATVGYTASGLPIVERVREGVWACGGYSGTGNLLGAVCGRLSARLAAGAEVEVPWPAGAR